MANQKITDLNKMQKLSKSDLLLVVDTDASGISGSSTGETMAIEATTLASQLAEIHQGDVGISLPALSDVPNDYSGWGGGYLQINESEDGVSFTDSPGASELSIPAIDSNGISNFYIPEGSTLNDQYKVGYILTRNGNKYRRASSIYKSEETDAIIDQSLMEVVGVIRKIKRQDPSDDSSEITHINIAFGGHVQFEAPDGSPVQPVTQDVMSQGTPQPTPLSDGRTYFLSSDNTDNLDGLLSSTDPASSFSDALSHVSKPVLVATSESSGVLVNYRGLICESGEEPHKFIIEVDASCSNVKVGDILRLKRKIRRNADKTFGTAPTSPFEEVNEGAKPSYLDVVIDGDYIMSNARAAYGDDTNPIPDEDRSYYTDILGIVIVSTPDYFQVQTSGMINFEKPNGIVNSDVKKNRPNAIFKRGYTYYLNSFEPESGQTTSTSQTRLSNTVYDYTSQQYEDAFQDPTSATWADTDMLDVTTGITPFRNVTIHNPFQRDSVTGKVTVYEKPVFYAVSDTQILLLNSPAYPSPIDQCNATNPDPTSSSFCGDANKTTNLTTTDQPYDNVTANKFLKSALPHAQENDYTYITHTGWSGTDTFIQAPGEFVTKKWYLSADVSALGVYGNWTEVTESEGI